MNVIEMHDICKYFGDFCANDKVCFCVKRGEIHALLGENGAGKSTLMNILYGLYSCDGGAIRINGKEVGMDNPSVAIKNGIGMVHQHFMLIPQLTVTENVFLGMKDEGFVMKKKELERRVRELNDKFGFNVKPDMPLWQLPVGLQQKVEILKVLMRKAQILILDEPTAVLTPDEVNELFLSIRALAENGYSIVLITHKMKEVMAHTDRVTVMRQGKVVGTVESAKTSIDELAVMMVGRSVSMERQVQPHAFGKPLLQVRDLTVKNIKGLEAVKGLSFDVKAGEIVGVAGVDGNGQLELGEAIIGATAIEKGSVVIDGTDVTRQSIYRHLETGFSYIPDDRLKKGLILQFPVKENMIIGRDRLAPYAKGLLSNKSAIVSEAQRLVEEFDVRPGNIEQPAGSLSGGNQQKVILAREVDRDPKVIVANQPTRGLDIGAIEFVRGKLVEERERGKAILLISTDLDEILSLSDRIYVIHSGKFVGEVNYDTDLKVIGRLMAGGGDEIAQEEATQA
ncbi:MAG: ABC transporter ATP-binding protein [Bacillota bacterium]